MIQFLSPKYILKLSISYNIVVFGNDMCHLCKLNDKPFKFYPSTDNRASLWCDLLEHEFRPISDPKRIELLDVKTSIKKPATKDRF